MYELAARILSEIPSCRSAAILAFVAGLAVTGPAVADKHVYTGLLSGSAIVPPTGSSGTGSIQITIDLVLLTMAVQANYSGLVGGAASAAHLHCCVPAGMNGVVAIPFPGFPNTTSGTYSNLFDMSLAGSYGAGFLTSSGGTATAAFNTFVAGLNARDVYFDIHDAVYPGGEIRANLTSLPILQSAASRKVHGAASTFDMPLSLVSVTNPTTEPRQGPTQTIVFTFDKPISSATATITEGAATPGVPTFTGNAVVVGLTGVNNQQYVTVSLTNVVSSDGGIGGSGSVRIGFLAGDVNQNRSVSLADLGLVNAQLAQTVTVANYLKDVNANGTVSLADKGITNANLAKALPPP